MVSRQRSPNYPRIDLETAIEYAKQLYRNVSRGEFTLLDAAKAWGYSSASGPVRSRVATLRQYGIVEGKKGALPRFTRAGQGFVVRTRASREYKEALREAALAPPLFQEMYDAKSGASDGAIREHLLLDKKFTEDGATTFVEVYRSSLSLAGLDENEDDIMTGLDEDELIYENEETVSSPSPSNHDPDARSVTLPVGEVWPTLTGPFPMPKELWDQMLDLLKAMEPGLVEKKQMDVDANAPDFPASSESSET